MNSHRLTYLFDWLLRIAGAAIMLQTLFFKFTGAAESIYIFSALGMEPWGRFGTGMMELVSSIMLLVPSTVAYGALLGIGLMAGAIFFHLSKLGIVVLDDHGQLFAYACVTMVISVILLFRHRKQFWTLVSALKSKRQLK